MIDPFLAGLLVGVPISFAAGMTYTVWWNSRIAKKTGKCSCLADSDEESYQ